MYRTAIQIYVEEIPDAAAPTVIAVLSIEW